jgi:hypothetical protein
MGIMGVVGKVGMKGSGVRHDEEGETAEEDGAANGTSSPRQNLF